jgi:DNA polymerase-3 subunit delta'
MIDGVIGHAAVVELLRSDVAEPVHAYLFVGPANVGKAAVARLFAAALLCGDDADCTRRAVVGIHPDAVVVEPDGRTALTVERARATVGLAALAPVEGARQVILIEEAGMMNDEAANALLKTLEEPSASTVFVLVADSADALPATIASRCRTIQFGRVTEEEVASALVGRGVPTDQATSAARISGGRPGLALALATQPEVASFRRAWLGVPMRLSAAPGDAYRLAYEVIDAAAPLLDALKERQAERAAAAPDGAAVADRHERELRRVSTALHETGLEILLSFYRDVAAAQLGAPVRNRDLPPAALTVCSPPAAVRRAGRVFETIDALEANQRPLLAFASLFADLGSET